MTHKTLMLIPGFMCNADLWRDQLPALRSLGRCLIPDITRGTSLSELAADALELCEGNFCLAGFSLGGFVAQEILRKAPKRVSRLALIGTSMRRDTFEKALQRKALSHAAAASGRFVGITDSLLRSYVHPSRLEDEKVVARIKTMTRAVGRETFLRQNEIERLDGEDVLRRVTCPVAILCGKEDIITPVSIHREMQALMPHSTIEIVEKCGHLAPLEQPTRVTRALLNLFEF